MQNAFQAPSSFEKARSIEKQGEPYILEFLRSQGFDGVVRTGNRGTASRELQARYGDVCLDCGDFGSWYVEIKVEKENRYQRLFLETWSNLDARNPGWLHKSTADYLFYFFLDTLELYIFPMMHLQRWAVGYQDDINGNLWRYKPRAQGKYDQRNNTVGVPVDIAVLLREVPRSKFISLHEEERATWEFWPDARDRFTTDPRDRFVN